MAKMLVLVVLAACSIGVQSQTGECEWGSTLSDTGVNGTTLTQRTTSSTSSPEWMDGRTFEENVALCKEDCENNTACTGIMFSPTYWEHQECFLRDGETYSQAGYSASLVSCDRGDLSDSTNCESMYNAVEGSPQNISSPDYPEEYPNSNDECKSAIYAEAGYQVVLEFTDFELEYDSECSYDYVEVYDGDSASAALIGRYCGTTSPGTITSTNGSLYVQFQSDSSVTHVGYLATFEAVAEVENCVNEELKKTKYVGTKLAVVYSEEHRVQACNLLNCVAYSCHKNLQKKGCILYSEVSGETNGRRSRKWTSYTQC